MLIVDFPPEEADAYRRTMQAAGLDTVFLASPTSDEGRLRHVDEQSSGFVYYVSRTGVTGADEADLRAVATQVAGLRDRIRLPICVGFGISRPDQAASLAGACEGVVVGSAFVNVVERIGRGEATLADLEAFVASMKTPLKQPVPLSHS